LKIQYLAFIQLSTHYEGLSQPIMKMGTGFTTFLVSFRQGTMIKIMCEV